MKKALTIYVDDDSELRYICGAFITDGGRSTSLLNEKIPENVKGMYLPNVNTNGVIQWIYKEDA